MIDVEGSMECDRECENVKLEMGDYSFKIHIFSIEIGACNVVLGVDWLINDGNSYTFRVIKVGS